MYAAQAGGLVSVAVLSGYDPIERLAKASPQVILPDVSVLPVLCASFTREIRADIVVKKLRIPVFIGVPEEERAKSQEVKVSLVMETREGVEQLEDEIEKTIDYYEVSESLRVFAASRPRKLIETLAEELAGFVMDKFNPAAVRVEVEKPILKNCEGVVVRCERRS